MRKSTKALIAIGAAIATPIIANHIITKKAQARIVPRENEALYNWEYGDIKYITRGFGEPLLLIHGIYPGASALEFKGIMEALSQNYKVYALDLLGFGYSDKPNISYSSYLYGGLIKDFIEDIIGSPVTAVASLHSAASLATCAKLNPESFKKVILISPTGTSDEANTSEWGGMMDQFGSKFKKTLDSPVLGTSLYHALTSKKALVEFLEREGLISYVDDIILEEMYLAAHAGGTGGKYPISALLSHSLNTDIKYTLENLTMPYHIITGDIDPDEKSSYFSLWQSPDESIEATKIEETCLLPHVDSPDAFYNILKGLI
ncbi:MAG: alpha/beta fold hydrolase [Defluviitaleaceae bacterium]|nr:alpha/beta fold hydrolase [Defluviitaleaceae bacterium]